jgi:hypothetical protein
VELANQAKTAAVAMAEPCDLMGPVRGVADENEASVGEPAEHQRQEPDHVLGRRAVPVPLTLVASLGAVKGDQYGQGPGTVGEGETDEHGEHDPLVVIPPSRKGVRRPNGVTVAILAVDVGPGVGDDGVVTDQDDRGISGEQGDEVSREGARQSERRPRGFGEDAAVAGGVPGRERSSGAEQIGDGPSPGREDCRPEQDKESLISWLGKDGCEAVQQCE